MEHRKLSPIAGENKFCCQHSAQPSVVLSKIWICVDLRPAILFPGVYPREILAHLYEDIYINDVHSYIFLK